MDSLKCLTFNVRGIRNRKKRLSIFQLFREQNIDVIALQETYLMEEDTQMLEKEWSGRVLLTEGTRRSKGLLLLFAKSLSDGDSIELLHSDSRMIVSLLKGLNRKIIIANIYAPCETKEKVLFFDEIKTTLGNIIRKNDDCQVVVLGDFNSVIDNKMDIVSGEPHNIIVVEQFQNLVNDLSLYDSWRLKHPSTKCHSWCKSNSGAARRLDYIFVSENLLPAMKSSKIESLGFSDHRAVLVVFSFSKFKHKPSMFKMNVSMLKNLEYVNIIKEAIRKAKTENEYLDPHLSWENIKITIKETTQQYCRTTSLKKNNELNDTIREINELEDILPRLANEERKLKLDRLNKLKQKLEIIRMHKVRGAQIRSGIKWIEEGERCTNYFLSLEKNRSNNNTITTLNDHCGNVTEDEYEIVENIRHFYANLYKEEKTEEYIKQGFANFVEDLDLPKISDDQKVQCERAINEAEVLNSLKRMKDGSSPGNDGIPTEFYKVFWNDIKDPLIECFNFSFEKGYLSMSQKMGVITLLLKEKTLNRQDLSNWRPISLTNTDYKIIAKTLAIRLSTVINILIHEDQKGFMKGRNIADVIREIDDVIEQEKVLKSNSILLSIDYKKAFDSISVALINETLKVYGFGENFCSWILTLMQDRKACVKNGGYVSTYFNMERGVRQGCPISPMLFILAVEVMARSARQDSTIKGVEINGKKIIIKQYADDTTFFLRDQYDMERILNKINEFSLFSGLTLNENKTKAMWLGDREEGDVFFRIKFVSNLKLLGIYFCQSMSISENKANWESRIESLKRVIGQWKRRDLSIAGKIIILKTFGISPFVYVLQSAILPQSVLREVTRLCFNFIWRKKTTNKRAIEKVKRTVMCNSYETGGLKMIDLSAFQKSFVINRINKLFNSTEEIDRKVPEVFFERLGGLRVFESNIQSDKFKGLDYVRHTYWKEAIKIWLDYKWNALNEGMRNSNILFNNDKIRFKGNSLFVENIIKLGVFYIKDCFKENELMTLREFKEKYGTYNGIELDYNIIANALKTSGIKHPNVTRSINAFNNLSRKDIYNQIKATGDVTRINSFWTRKGFNWDEDYWQIPYKCTGETRLRVLQWKILHNIYPTNILLHKMKIKDSNKCKCGEVDFLEHFFFYCKNNLLIWTEIENMINCKAGKCFKLEAEHVMLGITKINGVSSGVISWINHIILVAKMIISKIRYGPNIAPKTRIDMELKIRGLILKPNTQQR